MKIPRRRNRVVLEASTTGELFDALESFRHQLDAEGRYAMSMETSTIYDKDGHKIYQVIVECSSSKE